MTRIYIDNRITNVLIKEYSLIKNVVKLGSFGLDVLIIDSKENPYTAVENYNVNLFKFMELI